MSTLGEAEKKILKIYKAELSPPDTWELDDASKYRAQLSGATTGKIARFAPIGRVPMSNTSVPKSFPFLYFNSEIKSPKTVSDQELLRRGRLIRNAMNKYDPYSTDHFEDKVANRDEPVSPDSIRYNANLVDPPKRPHPVIEYIKTLPKSPGPRMKILSSAKDFQNTDYDADDLIFWTDGPLKVDRDSVTGIALPGKENLLNETLLSIHEAIKRHAGDFLLQLKEANEHRVNGIKNEIDRQLREFMKFGTTGNYVNRYTFMEVLRDFPTEADDMMYNYVLNDAMYDTFCKVIEIDSKGYRKWKRYVADKMARYLRFMTVHYKGKAETKTGGSKDMTAYETLNTKAEDDRKRINLIRQWRDKRVPKKRVTTATPQPSAPPASAITPSATPQPSAPPASAITPPATPQPSPPPPPKPFDKADVMKNMGKADPPCSSDKTEAGYIKRMTKLGFPKDDLKDPEKLRKLISVFGAGELKKLFNANSGICSTDQEFILTIMSGENKRTVEKYVKLVFGKNTAAGRANIASSWAQQSDFTFVKEKAQLYDDWGKQKCARINSGSNFKGGLYDTRIVKVDDLDYNDETVEIELIPTTIDETKNPIKERVSVKILTPLTKKECDDEAKSAGAALVFLLSQQKKAQEEEEKRKKEEAARKAAEEAAKKAAEEAARKAAEEAAKEAAKKANQQLDSATLLESSAGSSDWFILKEGNEKKFFLSKKERGDNLNSIIDSLPENDHILQYKRLTLKKVADFYLFEVDGDSYKVKFDDFLEEIILAPYMGKALKEGDDNISGPDVSVIREQALKGLKALRDKNIAHQDIKLENMVWDGQKLTIIDFGNARDVNKSCNSTFNGDKYNILPPDGVSSDPFFPDKWSLVLALLQYGKKTLYAQEDNVSKSKLTRVLFSALTKDEEDSNGCFELLPPADQIGLMFHNDGTNLLHRKAQIEAGLTATMFYHLWFIFNREEDFNKNNMKLGLLPGWETISIGMSAGKVTKNSNGKFKDDTHDYLDELVRRMGDTNIDLAKRWIQGHLRWNRLNAIVSTKEKMQFITTRKMKNEIDSKKGDFRSITIKDLGEEYYGIPTGEVVKIFEIIKEGAAATPSSSSANFSDLAYDSFSDAELDELEIAYEPYDEEELDRLMSEYESEAESEKSLAASYNSESENGSVAYNSESEQSLADSYNSESEQSLAYNSESERGSVSYNSESEQSLAGSYNSESEHGSVKYNSESENEKVDYTVGYDSDSD